MSTFGLKLVELGILYVEYSCHMLTKVINHNSQKRDDKVFETRSKQNSVKVKGFRGN